MITILILLIAAVFGACTHWLLSRVGANIFVVMLGTLFVFGLALQYVPGIVR